MPAGRARDHGRRPGAIRTFLIADIRGYTRFTDEFGDEAASRLASTFAEIVAEAMEAWDGQLVELRGDEALCTFESPRASLRCAIELQQTFAEEAAGAPDLPLRVGMGLDLGEAVPVGDGFRGAALNIAARLCAGAAAGEIRATDNLVHVAGPIPGIGYEPAGSEQLKGIATDVDVVHITAVPDEGEPSRDGIAPLKGRSPEPLPAELESGVPFLGRSGDLRWLRWHWRRARLGHGRVVEIVAAEGMGKTRLVAEVARLAHGEGAIVRAGAEHLRRGQPADPMRPTLVVVDDADRLPLAAVEPIDDLAIALDGKAMLVVATRSTPATDHRGPGRPHRLLEPMSEADVAEVAGLYAAEGFIPPLHDILVASAGVPRAVHRLASQWARAAALERMSESARRTSRERRGLRAAEEELIGRYAEIELARDRTSRYADEDVGHPGSAGGAVCPYKGLAAYEAADAGYYFGREQLVGELVARVVGSSFVGLVGASGSGKSSALSAGLLPALASGVLPGSGDWMQVPMRPGTRPMQALSSALRRADPGAAPAADDAEALLDRVIGQMAPTQRLLLVIDQFEEAFSANEAERNAFLDLITEGRPGMKVVLAVRADQYERCAGYPRLARLLAADQVLVGPLRSEEVAAIVRHPAERVGLRVEGELVDALIGDLGTEPGAMPLLSTALLELWEAREDGRLTLAAYRALGGVRGAVARLAESAYARLDPEEREAARSLFMRLIGEGSEPETIVRRRLSNAELDTMGDPRIPSVVEKLTAGRLLTRDEGTVEVAHEALIREWPRLREWIEADAAGREVRLHLIGAARTWDSGGREEGDLYRGARLAAALDWGAERAGELNVVERDFLDASRLSAERAAERQRRTNRILRGLLAGAGVLLVAAFGAGAVAWIQAGENATNASISQVREISLAALSLVSEDPELALPLAAEAIRMSREAGQPPPPQALQALWSAYTAGKSTTIVPNVGARAVAYSPDGATLAVDAPERDDALITLRDPSTGEELGTVPAPAESGEVQSIAYSPDGRWLAVAMSGPPGGGQGAVVVFDAASLELIHRLSAGHDGYGNLSLVESGLVAASGITAGEAEVATLVWDLANGQERAVLDVFGFASTDAVIRSTQARTGILRPGTEQVILGLLDVVSFHQAGLVGVSLPQAEPIIRCPPCPDVRSAWSELIDISPDIIAASPEGDRVAVADIGRGRVMVVDLVQRRAAFQPVVHRDPNALAWNAEGTLLAVAGGESGIVVLDASDGTLRLRVPSRGEPVLAVAFQPGADALAAVTADRRLRIHQTQAGAGEISTAGRQAVAIGATADHVVVSIGSDLRGGEVEGVAAAPGGRIAIHDRGTGVELHGLGFVVDTSLHGQVATLTDEVAAIYENGSSVLIEAASLREAARLPGCLGASGVSPDGAYVVLSARLALGESCREADVTSGIYERSSTDPLIEYGNERIRYGDVSSEVDGARFAAVTVSTDAAQGGMVEVWEVTTRRRLATLDEATLPGFLPAYVSFSPDARYLAIGTNGPRALVIDVVALADGGSLDEATVFDHEVHTSSAPKAMVTDDGLLATAGGEGVYRFWDLGSGEMTMELQVSGLLGAGMFAFSPDFETFYYEDGAGIIRPMPVDVDEMVELATSGATRTLTDAECREYLHVEACPASAPAD